MTINKADAPSMNIEQLQDNIRGIDQLIEFGYHGQILDEIKNTLDTQLAKKYKKWTEKVLTV